MLRIFNCGIGMTLVIDPRDLDSTINVLSKHKFKGYLIGKVTERSSTKITFVLGDCTFKKWPTDAMIFLDPPWEAGMEQMQNWLAWAKDNFQFGIAKLPKEFYLSNDEQVELILSSEGYPRYMLCSW